MVHLIGIPLLMGASFAAAWIWKSHLVHEAEKLRSSAWAVIKKETGK